MACLFLYSEKCAGPEIPSQFAWEVTGKAWLQPQVQTQKNITIRLVTKIILFVITNPSSLV